jgi:hypothetical protein
MKIRGASMRSVNLVLALPSGSCTATSLGLEGFARHRSPGSGQVFHGRQLYVDLRIDNGRPAFRFADEGGWRDVLADTQRAIAACETKRTKTALSNNAFSIIPLEAYRSISLVKTGGHVLTFLVSGELRRFRSHACHEGMSPNEVAEAAGLPGQAERRPRSYLVLGPVEMVVLSNLTPEEYVWYATHRPGKLFRQVLFTEITPDPRRLVAEQAFEEALAELAKDAKKKTKTICFGSALDKVPLTHWIGYGGRDPGGIYCGDREKVILWKWPGKLPASWERGDG